MSKKPALGKGLGALIPTAEGEQRESRGVFVCPVEEIRSNPDQPRKRFDEQALESLAATIREKGILQPLLVRRVGSRFELIAGERRLRAAVKAGLKEVPVVLRDAEDADRLELSILENVQREDLDPIEEARAYKQMVDRLGLTQEEVARRVGKDRSSVANALRLLQLPREIQEDLSGGGLSPGHARAILAAGPEVMQLRAWKRIKEKGLSVREAERYVNEQKGGRKAGGRKAEEPKDPDMQALEDELSRHFGTRVVIQEGKRGGKIQIRYSSVEELNRLYTMMVR